MKPATKRSLSLLASALFLIAAFVVYVLLIRPSYDEVLRLRGELKSRDKFLQEQSLVISKVNDLILQYQGSGRLQDTISLSYPLAENLSSIFDQVRTLAGINGLSVEIFSVKPLNFQELTNSPLIKNSGTLQISLKLIGSYESFKGFVKGVETNVRVMDIQQISIERLAGPSSNLFAYNLSINAYYQQ